MTLLYILAAVLVVVGLAGIFLPALPGIPLIFAGMLVAAFAGGFEQVGAGTLFALGVLTLLSVAVDFWATAMGARRVGASRLAIIGAVAGELLHGRRLDQAGLGQATKVGFGTWMGIVFGIALKLMLALAMLGLFAWSWWH